jgi:hypothetical protein
VRREALKEMRTREFPMRERAGSDRGL